MKGKQRVSKGGRPVRRRHAFMFALRGVRTGGMYHAEFQKLLANNGGKKVSALTAISRKGLKLMFRIAKERRPYVPMDDMVRGKVVTTPAFDVTTHENREEVLPSAH